MTGRTAVALTRSRASKHVGRRQRLRPTAPRGSGGLTDRTRAGCDVDAPAWTPTGSASARPFALRRRGFPNFGLPPPALYLPVFQKRRLRCVPFNPRPATRRAPAPSPTRPPRLSFLETCATTWTRALGQAVRKVASAHARRARGPVTAAAPASSRASRPHGLVAAAREDGDRRRRRARWRSCGASNAPLNADRAPPPPPPRPTPAGIAEAEASTSGAGAGQ